MKRNKYKTYEMFRRMPRNWMMEASGYTVANPSMYQSKLDRNSYINLLITRF